MYHTLPDHMRYVRLRLLTTRLDFIVVYACPHIFAPTLLIVLCESVEQASIDYVLSFCFQLEHK